MANTQRTISQGLATKENWINYYKNRGSAVPGGLDYVEANEDIVIHLEEMLQKAADFNILKNELTSFINERKDFISFALENEPNFF